MIAPHMIRLEGMDFIQVPKSGFYIQSHAYEPRAPDGVITGCYKANDICERLSVRKWRFSLPTSQEWDMARSYLAFIDGKNGKAYHEGYESHMISRKDELTGTIVDFSENCPVIITGAVVKGGKIEGGKRRNARWLLKKRGYVSRWNNEFGIPADTSSVPDERFHGAYYWPADGSKKMSVVMRKLQDKDMLSNRFCVDLRHSPDEERSGSMFRLVARPR